MSSEIEMKALINACEQIARLKALCLRAAEALENHVNYAIDLGMSDDKVLIAELREASK